VIAIVVQFAAELRLPYRCNSRCARQRGQLASDLRGQQHAASESGAKEERVVLDRAPHRRPWQAACSVASEVNVEFDNVVAAAARDLIACALRSGDVDRSE